ncbi:antibiotic biosynthesis monooxygenase [Alphaproteobacteria bacterium]|jgi:autoinducer 2-degrading protein|nr:antibiotic biosynthesis monooxygenase [Alphaproteobacteria bacterium]MDB4857821.1 antibiotic biosynthesis monooxygenase [Alphaproteobacteria bacterium]MDC3193039.1 antibiotic biosynthesis monooxygenase [Alphaproteobacteria bacterium]
MLAVCVDFEIDSESLDAFLSIMQKNASDSLANEVGCHQFDITQDPQSPTKIFLYELYDDAVAFEMHKQASHYLEFNDAINGMVDKKSVRLLQKINC